MSNQPEPIQIPDLGGIITTNDLYKKGRFTYSAWAKTAQRIRENAPNWFFALQPDPNGQLVWMAPNNTGYLMGYFENVVTNVKLPLFPYAITDNTNKAIKYENISANHIQNSQRRHLCACACFSFGDAYELWADVEVKDLDQPKEEPEVADNTVERTPTKINQEPEENYLLPQQINPKARDLICDDVRNSGHQKQILKDFKEHFKLKVANVHRENITLSEHGRFLRQAIEKYNDKN